MPYKTLKPCNVPGCGALINTGERFCAAHKREYNQSRRDNNSHYDRHWRKISALYLAKNPICVECNNNGRLTPATETHHIIPVDKDGSDRNDNLMALCKSCHSRITLKERQHGI